MFSSKVCVISDDGLCEGFQKKLCVRTTGLNWSCLLVPRTPLWRDVINQERACRVWVYRSLQTPVPTDERNLKLVVTHPLWLTSDSKGGDWTLEDVAASWGFKPQTALLLALMSREIYDLITMASTKHEISAMKYTSKSYKSVSKSFFDRHRDWNLQSA